MRFFQMKVEDSEGKMIQEVMDRINRGVTVFLRNCILQTALANYRMAESNISLIDGVETKKATKEELAHLAVLRARMVHEKLTWEPLAKIEMQEQENDEDDAEVTICSR